MVRLVVVEDQAAVREGLVLLVGTVAGIDVVGQAADGDAAVAVVERERPDVVLMDLHMPRRGGVEATERIRARFPDVQVVVLTTYSDDDSILGALRAGAVGYLTKSADRHQIGRAVHAAAAGTAVLDPSVQRRLVAAAGAPRAVPADDLTDREGDVLRRLATGRNNREIARDLVITEATVKSHINRIFAKTGSRDRAQAIRYAYEHGYTVSR